MKVGIIQSSYIPWRGYFDIVHEVDRFIFLDDVLFSKGSWRNRNRIKTPKGSSWLSIPLKQQGLSKSLIDEVQFESSVWQAEHLRRIVESYESAPHFAELQPLLAQLYTESQWQTLSEFNQFSTQAIAKLLGSQTEFVNSRALKTTGNKDDKVIQLLKAVGATEYLSGPSASNYLDEAKYRSAKIEVIWKEYSYPEYPQLYPPFDGAVSIIDLLAMTGPAATSYIWPDRNANLPS